MVSLLPTAYCLLPSAFCLLPSAFLRAQTLAPFKADVSSLSSGLVGAWSLNASTSDALGLNNATWSGTAQGTNGYYSRSGYDQPWAAAFGGPGVATFLTIGTSSTFNYTTGQSVSVCAQFYHVKNIAQGQFIWGKLSAANKGFALGWNTSDVFYMATDAGYQASSSSYDTAWTDVCAVWLWNGSSYTQNLYVNGALDNTGVYNASSTLSASGTAPLIGGKCGGCGGDTSFFDGLLQRVGIWNRALSASEVSKWHRTIATSPLYLAATFTYHTAPPTATSQQLSISTSADGTNWTDTYSNVYAGHSPNQVRDPSIFWDNTTQEWWVFHTAANWTSGGIPSNNLFDVVYSTNLSNWTWLTSVDPGVAGETNVWAPEPFIDSDNSVHAIVAVSTNNYSTFELCEVHPIGGLASGNWSTCNPLTFSGTAPTTWYDAFVLLLNGTYYLFCANQANRYIEYATASALMGPYTVQGTGNWAGWGSGVEGPALLQWPDGTWAIYMDGAPGKGAGYWMSQSPNWPAAGASSTWSTPIAVNNSFTMQHGTFMHSPYLHVGGN
jgi:hypothetical protein